MTSLPDRSPGLARNHRRFPKNNIPRRWILTFTEGSDELTARCYLHGTEYAQQGWFPTFDRVMKLSKPFEMRLPGDSGAGAFG